MAKMRFTPKKEQNIKLLKTATISSQVRWKRLFYIMLALNLLQVGLYLLLNK
jgi:uncharacterized protein YpmS